MQRCRAENHRNCKDEEEEKKEENTTIVEEMPFPFPA
jgi:hypothetical protein